MRALYGSESRRGAVSGVCAPPARSGALGGSWCGCGAGNRVRGLSGASRVAPWDAVAVRDAPDVLAGAVHGDGDLGVPRAGLEGHDDDVFLVRGGFVAGTGHLLQASQERSLRFVAGHGRSSCHMVGNFVTRLAVDHARGTCYTIANEVANAEAVPMSIQLTHSAGSGTLALGTSKGDGSASILKSCGFRWSRNINGGTWYLPQSRDRAPRMDRIERTVSELRTAGLDVEVEVDTALRSTAEVEADRAERAETRAAGLAAKAERWTATGEAEWERTQQLRELIPLGQPVMPDHYSYSRDMNFRNKLHRKEARAIETLKAGEDAARRAESAAFTQQYRESGPVTERRIKDLEAELRRILRDRDGYTRNFHNGRGEYRERLEVSITEVTEQLTYWRDHLAKLTADGEHRVWGPGDFSKGDQVEVSGRWYEVLRVNKKSLTVPSMLGSWTDTVPYDKVCGHRQASEIVNLDAGNE